MIDWRKYKFADFVSINPTVSLKGTEQYSFVEMKDLKDGSKFCYPSAKRKTSSGARFQEGDTLFARITPCLENGKICQVRGLENGIGFGSTEFLIFRGREKISNNDFVFYLSRWDEVRAFAESNFEGTSGRQRVNKNCFDNLILRLPLVDEQNKIAEVLNSFDDKINLLYRQNRTLTSIAEAIFRQTFLEESVESWDNGKLGDILSVIESGSRPKGGIDSALNFGIPSIGAENVNGLGIYDFTKTKYISEEFYRSMRRGLIQDYDVLIYKDGAYVGRKGMFGNGFPFSKATVNEHVFILRGNERVNQFFLYFLLQQNELEQLNANSAQPGLNQEAMKSFEIVIPPPKLVSEFGNTVKPLIDKIFFNSSQIKTLSILRDTLLPKLMSGEIRVI